MDFERISAFITETVVTYAPRLLAAIAVFIIGRWIIRSIVRFFGKTLDKRNVDDSLKPFLRGMVNTLLMVLLVISVLSMMGVQMTAFIAVIGAVGLAVGLALSGTLQNFAGGVIILLFKPFKVGDFIDTLDYTGTVSEILIFNTILKTPDNKTVILPNGEVATSSLVNFSTESKRRVDWTFGIGYGDSTEEAIDLLKRLLREDSRILNEPEEPFLAVSELADSSVNIVTRAWVDAENYWPVFFEMNQKVYNAFNKEGFNIPFPQMDVHVHGSGSEF